MPRGMHAGVIALLLAAACGDNADGTSADARSDGPPVVDAAPDADIDAEVQPPAAVVRLNEINPELAGDCDLIELRVISGGTMQGVVLRASGAPLVTFTGFLVDTNDMVLVHINGDDVACNPGNSADETSAPNQQPTATFAANVDTAFDWYAPATDLEQLSNVIDVLDALGGYLDVVFTEDGSVIGVVPNPTVTAANAAAGATEWPTVAGGYDADNFRPAAVHTEPAEAARAGISIGRNNDLDNNGVNDWTDTNVSSWGERNLNQSPL